MRAIILAAFLFPIAYALGQTCIVSAPVAPPVPRQLVVSLPVDGGTQGCTARAYVPGAVQASDYAIGNAKCAQAVGIAQQAAANDNGWNDGGAP